ncbi:hypothetical protein [Brevundimonas sp.]|jgi:hypothetical protein|uniref:hypothetical protein n=1 Tax=Brevundimonas sp. TaxID=1871086 RepID=UPI00391B9866|nr:hypothetical protein [Brevundimonas sp.]MCA3718629.1 hypothetical protein [Brevundimonas sp.]
MLFRLLLSSMVFALVVPTCVQAQETPSVAELRQGLAGRWSGALGYRDYQTDRLFEIPLTTTIEALPDGVTTISRSLYDDGPDKPVWITTVRLEDPVAGTSSSASFRAGQAPALSTEAVRVSAYRDPQTWSLTSHETAEDNDEPAEIRLTETRDGDSLIEVKEVRPVGAGEDAWRFRNQTRLTRIGD